MTGDHSYKFTFYKAGANFPTSIFDNEIFEIQEPGKPKVALFSGGIDSLTGVIEAFTTSDSKIKTGNCLALMDFDEVSVKN